jgi:protein-L-isoaspartate(D-aspartate) O-methyltransferase
VAWQAGKNHLSTLHDRQKKTMDARDSLIEEIDAEMRATARWTGRQSLAPRVRAALRAVRREAFVPSAARTEAYENHPLRIGHGQTISQPFVVALMTDLLDLAPDHVVLEVGTGSGYQAAVLAQLVRHVYSIECIAALSTQAAIALLDEGVNNVTLTVGDGAAGWPEHAQYDRIIVTAAGTEIPPTLVDQLRPGGRMVIPVGQPREAQELILVEKGADGVVRRREVLSVAFVPLVTGKPT